MIIRALKKKKKEKKDKMKIIAILFEYSNITNNEYLLAMYRQMQWSKAWKSGKWRSGQKGTKHHFSNTKWGIRWYSTVEAAS